ncbi:P-loop containing nucleoside triphosphate hydrolase protein [Melanogaster broomeanus]|nr:P-loop containing nucleoside triphosphate hydrolase protein [Melanogaster broomeanus]
MRSIICFVSFLLIAGQSLALTIDVGGTLGNVAASDFLNVTDTYLLSDCQTQCTNATDTINNCGTSDQCLCGPSTVIAITSCQQCMFNDLVTKFAKSSDPRAGSATALTAYAAACLASANVTIPASFIALAPPSNWDGPFGVHLGVPETILEYLAWSLINLVMFLQLVVSGIWMYHSTFIGIRHYFKNLSRQTNSRVNDEQPYLCRSHLSSSASSHAAAAALQKPSFYELPMEIYFSEQSPLSPSTRFDWRLRATSRYKGTLDPPYKQDGRRVYMKRTVPTDRQLQPDEPFYEEIQAYNNRFLPLLEAEQAEVEAVLYERLSTWPLSRLREEGYCITDLSAFWVEAPQFRNPIACFTLGPGVTLPEHRFQNGTQILLSQRDPLHEVPVRGTVMASSATQLRVAFQEKLHLDGDTWRLDIGQSNIVFDRMRAAVSHFKHDPEALVADQAPDRQYIMQGTHLRDVLLRSFSPTSASLHQPLQAPDAIEYVSHDTLEHQSRDERDHGGCFKDDMRIQSWARRYARKDPIKVDGDPVLECLNSTQIRAAAMMIGERISLVQGPPGTGKTKTIIETVKLLKAHFEVHHPVLVCTYTNTAVDNLVEGFAAVGVKPLRIGAPGKIKDCLMEHTLDYKLDQHVLKPKVDRLLQDQKDIQKRWDDLTQKIEIAQKAPTARSAELLDRMRSALVTKERQLMAVKSKLYAIHQEMLRDITSAADVICTTCITSASVALNVLDFPVVFLDEASMSTEPASLIPLMKGSQHVALIGDHKQLPPVITSREAQFRGLGISLFERLTDERVVPSIMLDIQYRMHPSISHFPSLEFYNLTLLDGTVDTAGNISPQLLPPLSRHLPVDILTGHRPSVVFLDHGGSETAKDRSRVNRNEAYIVCSIVEDLLLQNEVSSLLNRFSTALIGLRQKHLRGEDIGIIAPYAAQISLLTRLLNSDEKYRKRFSVSLGDYRQLQLSSIEVKTVDGFEGREKDVIIFSTVRNNSSGYIGFLADRRRLNVGLTRAKRGLFIVGSINTLKESKMSKRQAGEDAFLSTLYGAKGVEAWKRYAEYLVERQMVLTLPEERLRIVQGGNKPSLLRSPSFDPGADGFYDSSSDPEYLTYLRS